MHGLTMDYIPLILEQSNHIVTYIINNQILGTEKFGFRKVYPYRAFHLLVELAKNEETKTTIPKELLAFLQTEKTIPLYFKNDFIIGEMENDSGEHCIYLEMNIQKSARQPVLLSKFEYFSRKEDLSLDFEVRLTGLQAFFILANIVTNARCELYLYFKEKFHRNNLEALYAQELVDFDSYTYKRFGQIYFELNEFALQYMKYIKRNLLMKTISPEEVLITSGAQVLAFLSYLPVVEVYLEEIKHQLTTCELPHTQRALYHTFHSSIGIKEDQSRNDYIDENRLFLDLFEKQVAKKFPV